ncbi:hypothetical protein NDU88_004059 [Pleurodeles waltl]|uniref:Myb/SANT-like DNA-binding domain-containing protein n=1 Tax=Pleurodeles waltl TaxID=8319 RepID=A0AAV7VG04_PLEWA|nr:hypothetical protein NDU88_004059 [Pleurodeles waltl]
MVEEIIRVEPQLFGSQVQHTTIARKAELWQRIVDRVNAVGQHPRNREDIRKRWNDLRGKVRSMVSRHNIAVQKTGGEPPPTPPEFTTWEQEVLNILHPDGLAGVHGGMDSGTSGSGHTVQGTEAQGNRATRRAAVRQGGEERPREPTLQEALTTIMAAYHHSQETMATVLARFQEIQAQQEQRYMGFSDQLSNISTAMGSIVQALNRIEDTFRDHVASHRAPVTSQEQEQPTTSAGASGQEAPSQGQPPRTPPPAEQQPPRKRSLRLKKTTE